MLLGYAVKLFDLGCGIVDDAVNVFGSVFCFKFDLIDLKAVDDVINDELDVTVSQHVTK